VVQEKKNKWSKKPLSDQDIALQEFIMIGIDTRKFASMIYNVRRNKGEGIGFTEDFGKPKVSPPPCSNCIKKGLNACFVSEADKTEVVIRSEPEASESKTMNISKSKIPKSRVVNDFNLILQRSRF
jgi:hypothetical protein